MSKPLDLTLKELIEEYWHRTCMESAEPRVQWLRKEIRKRIHENENLSVRVGRRIRLVHLLSAQGNKQVFMCGCISYNTALVPRCPIHKQ